ncbi:MAG: 30S ribosomal protein S1 [Bacteroidota bacterium]
MENEELNNEEVASTTTENTADTAVVETKKKKSTFVETAHDDFDWNIDKRGAITYTAATSKAMDEMYDATISTVNNAEIVPAIVASITSSDVVLNIGFKSDGLVPLSEFRDNPDLKVGDKVNVFVISKEDSKGQLVLSRKNAKLLDAWDQICDAYKNDIIVKGTIMSKTKGGLIANVFGLDTFLPGSQIDVKPITDYDIYVGKTMEFKIVKINEIIKNAVVSHKALIESDIEDQRQEIISKLEKGQVLEGVIKNITDFGAFIDLGGVDGLLYITDISWGRINHPNEVLELNQKLNVVVIEFDDNKKRISLGLKQLTPHPWENLDPTIEVGSKVSGKIVNIEDYGAFLELTPGIEGLIHVSEVSWSNQPVNSREYFKLGDTHEAIVMTIDKDERKMSLSIKRLLPDPWEKAMSKYTAGTKHSGTVKNITPYGVFVELEDGIGGMIHISDLSWTKRYNHPNEFTKLNEKLEVVVLDVDSEGRKLSLGHKQIEEDPWDTFETAFPVGSIHEGQVIDKDEKGAKIGLPYGLEGYAPAKHLKKADNTFAVNDEKIPVKIIDFNRNDKKIMVSHLRFWEDNDRDAKNADRAAKNEETETARKVATSINSKNEKSTLGDLDALSNLKEQMEKDAKSKSTFKPEGDDAAK